MASGQHPNWVQNWVKTTARQKWIQSKKDSQPETSNTADNVSQPMLGAAPILTSQSTYCGRGRRCIAAWYDITCCLLFLTTVVPILPSSPLYQIQQHNPRINSWPFHSPSSWVHHKKLQLHFQTNQNDVPYGILSGIIRICDIQQLFTL